MAEKANSSDRTWTGLMSCSDEQQKKTESQTQVLFICQLLKVIIYSFKYNLDPLVPHQRLQRCHLDLDSPTYV